MKQNLNCRSVVAALLTRRHLGLVLQKRTLMFQLVVVPMALCSVELTLK